MQLLVVNPTGALWPDGAESVLAGAGWTVTVADDCREALDVIADERVEAVLLVPPDEGVSGASWSATWDALVQRLAQRRLVAMVVARDDAPGLSSAASLDSLIEVVPPDITAAELRGRLSVIARYQGLLKRMERELQNMEEMSTRLKEHFHLIDQEMQLAGRLQRDFLPASAGAMGPARYASLFRPASWVSGDIYDIVPIDASHTGVYVADAVGHGMAAGLLTMFIKRAIAEGQRCDSNARMLHPDRVLCGLNDALAEQSLPNCQFVTACYGVLDHETLRFQCARGGHPGPMLLRADGSCEEIEPDGGLLGLTAGERFEVCAVQLAPGDKLLIYTDGLELSFQSDADALDTSAYKRVFRALSGCRIEPMLAELRTRLDAEAGSIQPRDDVTIVGIEMPPS